MAFLVGTWCRLTLPSATARGLLVFCLAALALYGQPAGAEVYRYEFTATAPGYAIQGGFTVDGSSAPTAIYPASFVLFPISDVAFVANGVARTPDPNSYVVQFAISAPPQGPPTSLVIQVLGTPYLAIQIDLGGTVNNPQLLSVPLGPVLRGYVLESGSTLTAAATLTTVPEPGGILPIAVGLMALAAWRRHAAASSSPW